MSEFAYSFSLIDPSPVSIFREREGGGWRLCNIGQVFFFRYSVFEFEMN